MQSHKISHLYIKAPDFVQYNRLDFDTVINFVTPRKWYAIIAQSCYKYGTKTENQTTQSGAKGGTKSCIIGA